MTDDNAAEHAFAQRYGFYREQMWWIETFTIRRGQYYRFQVAGTNGMKHDEPISWSVPNLRGRFAFRLRPVIAHPFIASYGNRAYCQTCGAHTDEHEGSPS